MRILRLMLIAATVAGCSVDAPLRVTGEGGMVLEGNAHADMSTGGTWVATNGRLTCSGTYDAYSTAISLEFIAHCSDGRRGIGVAVRDPDLMSGRGSVKMEDGTVVGFVFGRYVTGK